jgi:hypothetical protein
MKRWFWALALLLSPLAPAQISCGSGFTASGACSIGSGSTSFSNPSGSNNPATESGGVITIMPSGCGHCASNLWYNTKQNVQNFNTSFTFVPNDSSGLGFAIQNTSLTNNGAAGLSLSAGASGELGLSQFDSTGGPNNIFYLKFDRYFGNLTQLYIQDQCPSQNPGANCNEVIPVSWQNALLPAQFSLSPINLASNAPYTASITYDGFNLCMSLTDSAANSYGPKCWKVNIPGIVGGTTAYVGFGASTGLTNSTAGTISNFAFASGSNAIKPTQAAGHTTFAGTMH